MILASQATTGMRIRAAIDQRLLGLAFASILPALFWVALVRVSAPLLALDVTPVGLALIGFGISGFLAAVCAPLMLRSE